MQQKSQIIILLKRTNKYNHLNYQKNLEVQGNLSQCEQQPALQRHIHV